MNFSASMGRSLVLATSEACAASVSGSFLPTGKMVSSDGLRSHGKPEMAAGRIIGVGIGAEAARKAAKRPDRKQTGQRKPS
jgi:hypothetical protein